MGPWIVGKQHMSRVGDWTTQVIPVSAADHARAVALVYAGFGDGDEVARLLAAAPDMLEALEEARIALKHCVENLEFNSLPESAFRAVRAAIAKATSAA
jgi:hypothetical protein